MQTSFVDKVTPSEDRAIFDYGVTFGTVKHTPFVYHVVKISQWRDDFAELMSKPVRNLQDMDDVEYGAANYLGFETDLVCSHLTGKCFSCNPKLITNEPQNVNLGRETCKKRCKGDDRCKCCDRMIGERNEGRRKCLFKQSRSHRRNSS